MEVSPLPVRRRATQNHRTEIQRTNLHRTAVDGFVELGLEPEPFYAPPAAVYAAVYAPVRSAAGGLGHRSHIVQVVGIALLVGLGRHAGGGGENKEQKRPKGKRVVADQR